MTAEPGIARQESPPGPTTSNVYAEGILAGLVGAGAIAIWFLILDTVRGRPFYTPTVLAPALFRGTRGLPAPDQLSPSLERVLSFTWVLVLAFLLIRLPAA